MKTLFIIFLLLFSINAQILNVKDGWSLFGATEDMALKTIDFKCTTSVFTYKNAKWNSFKVGESNNFNVNKASGFWLNGNNNCLEDTSNEKKYFTMPDEASPHKTTWISFVARDYIWELNQINEVKRNLALIAKTIAKYEPVSILVSPNDKKELIQLLGGINAHKYPIKLYELEIDDLWLRDSGPTFVYNDKNEKVGIDFNFNGWGEKQTHTLDKKVANFINNNANVDTIKSNITIEGGCFEVDGFKTALVSESCVIINNRNPNMNKQQIEVELKKLLGIKKIIWLKGIKGKDITDGHIDFYARFIKQGVVAVSRDTYEESFDYKITRENIKILENSRDADGNKLKLIILDTPSIINEDFGVDNFAGGYVGFYVLNNAVIMQGFGDEVADTNAKNAIQLAFPNRKIEQISIDGIASGGGSIHCATQQEPIEKGGN